MTGWRVLRSIGVCLCAAVAGCGRTRADAESGGGAPAAVAVVADAGAAPRHGNHDPKYGGVVLMNGDLHFEVICPRDGHYQVYFSDAARAELPASVVSIVTITVTRSSGPPESVSLQIDDSGESWVGGGRPVDDPVAVARIGYSWRGSPYWIDLPFSAASAATSRE
jgi:hypothetical protein